MNDLKLQGRSSKERSGFFAGHESSGLLGSLGVVVVLVLWTAASTFDWLNDLILPSPARVVGAFSDVGWSFARHTGATLLRVGSGLIVGGCLGFTLGLLMQYSRAAFIVLDGLIETARPVPPVAVVPFFVLLFGFAERGKVLVITLGVALIMVVATTEAAARVPPSVIRWGLVRGLSRERIFGRIVIPAMMPDLKGGVRISLASAMTLAIVAEFMGARSGLGYLISVSKVTLTTPTLIAAIFIIGWASWLLDRLVRATFAWLTDWDVQSKEVVR